MTKPFNYLLIFSLCYLTIGCWPINNDDDVQESNYFYKAVVMNRAEFEKSTDLLPEQPIINSGKIYVKGDLLLINELNEGFHLIDNSNPADPTNVAFLKVLGSSDVAIKNDMLYVNNATDLLALKIDLANRDFSITKRVIDAFPELRAPGNNGFYDTAENEIIINWILNND